MAWHIHPNLSGVCEHYRSRAASAAEPEPALTKSILASSPGDIAWAISTTPEDRQPEPEPPMSAEEKDPGTPLVTPAQPVKSASTMLFSAPAPAPTEATAEPAAAPKPVSSIFNLAKPAVQEGEVA